MQKPLKSILLLIGFLSINATYCQTPDANFSANKVTSCDNLTVIFTDNSTNSPTSWKWDFGNGETSTAQHPIIFYEKNGTYNVKLIVKNDNGSDTLERIAYIRILKSPIADFSSDKTTICSSEQVQFTDETTVYDGEIKKWNWSFGDNYTSLDTNPVHTYQKIQTFSVTLKVTDIFQCSNQITKNAYILTKPSVSASFTVDKHLACEPPLTVNFTNTSTPSDPSVNYTWIFGDNKTSSIENPSNTFSSQGKYDPYLIASNGACSDTMRLSEIGKYVDITTFETDFTTNLTTGCSPLNIIFSDESSSSASSWNWSFGHAGKTSTQQNPNYTYQDTGTFNIKLISSNAAGCTDTSSSSITVYKSGSTIDFTVNQSKFCYTPSDAIFTVSQASIIRKYTWDFGDGNQIVENINGTPPSTYKISHTYKGENEFSVSLTTIDINGCVNSVSKSNMIEVVEMSSGFFTPISNGCAPVKTVFKDFSTSSDTITNWKWDFGQGTTSTAQNSDTIIYGDTGVFDVSLIITTHSGCTDTITKEGIIKAGTIPQSGFQLSDTIGCHPLYAEITNTASSFANDISYFIPRESKSLNIPNPNFTFNDTGYFDILQITGHYGCYSTDTFKIENAIFVQGPKPQFDVDSLISCDSTFSFTFTNLSIDADSTIWDFGDESSTEITTPNNNLISHSYNKPGKFNVSIICSNSSNGCIDTLTVDNYIKISKIKANICEDEIGICDGNGINFKDCSESIFALKSWQWMYGDGKNSSFPNPSHTYANCGKYNVILRVFDVNNCSDQITKSQFVDVWCLPTSRFSADKNSGCADLLINFTDSSSSTPTTTIDKHTWDFGDGNIDTTNGSCQHTYTTDGNYNVSLTVTDSKGCKKTLTKNKYILSSKPEAIISSDSVICYSDTVRLKSNSTTITNKLTYLWDLGESGITSADNEPSRFYSVNNNKYFTIILDIEDTLKCKDSDTSVILIQRPYVNFNSDDTLNNCYPFEALLNSESTDPLTKWDWSINNSYSDTTFHMTVDTLFYEFNHYGYYDIILIGETQYGCKDTLEKKEYFFADGPQGSFDFNPKSGCLPLEVTFIAQHINTERFKWVFGNKQGMIIETSNDTIKYTYTEYDNSSVIKPFVLIYDSIKFPGDSVCPVTLPPRDTIKQLSVLADFSSKDSICQNDSISFTNKSNSSDTISKWEWIFGNETSNEWHYSRKYATEGIYEIGLRVELLVSSNPLTYCKDSLSKRIKVHPLPVAGFTYTQDFLDLYSNKIEFQDTSTGNDLSWLWEFGDGNTSINQNPTNSYDKLGEYAIKLQIITSKGCSDTKYKKIQITESFIPNAFTPDGDGINDVFPQDIKVLNIKIFNRWGNTIYIGAEPWDGKYNNEYLLSGTYFYVLTVLDIDGKENNITGNITLIRR